MRVGVGSVAGWVSLFIATAVILWTSISMEGPHLTELSPRPVEYYTRQTAGFAAGELSMRVTPHPHVSYVASDGHPVPEPFLLDASFYKDRYYLYFGAAPILAIFMPVFLLTGAYPNEPFVALLFVVLGFWTSVAWVATWKRHAAPSTPVWIWSVLVLAMGLCTGALPTLRRSLFYEVAASSGYFWSMVGLLACTQALFHKTHKGRWLSLAGFAIGMAGASRGTLLPLLILLPVLAAWCTHQNWKNGARNRWALLQPWLFAGFPATAILIGLLGYNFARFGHPLEFGFRFQVNGMPPKMFSVSWVWHNLRYYYFAKPQLYPYFPFVAPVPDIVRPAQYWSYEQAHGQAYMGPLVVALLAAVVWRWKKLIPGSASSAAFVFTAVWFAVAAAPMAAAGVRANRYMLDFQPVLLGLVTLTVSLFGTRRSWLSRMVTTASISTLLVGAAFNFFASLHSHGWLRDRHRNDYTAIARRFDRAAWPILSHFAEPPGARSLDITFPATRAAGTTEPVFVAGIYEEADALLVQYLSPGTARFIFEHHPYGDLPGPAFTYTPGKPMKMDLEVGAFYPPLDHPWWKDRPEAEQQQLQNRVVVRLDGKQCLNLQVPCYSIPPSRIVWGKRDRVIWTAPEFGGVLSEAQVSRPSVDWLAERRSTDRVFEAQLLLPRDRYGTMEPIASIGLGMETEMISIEYSKPTYVRFVHSSPGVDETSAPVEVVYEVPHAISVEPIGAAKPGGNPGYRIWVDGAQVWSCGSSRKDDSRIEIVPLSNTQKRGPARHVFGGETLRLSYIPVPSVAETQLPAFFLPNNSDRIPILSLVSRNSNGTLSVRRRDHRDAELIWRSEDGRESTTLIGVSDRVPLGFVLEEGKSEYRLRKDGEIVWRHSTVDKESARWRLEPWKNAATGDVATVPLIPVWKPAIIPGDGPIRLRVRFPTDRQGHAEPLIVTGMTGAGDAVYVKYLGPDTISIGADHWGIGGPSSPPIKVDLSIEHELWISMGSLFENQPLTGIESATRVWLDGREAFAWDQPTHSTATATLQLGENKIGISTCESVFTGTIIRKSRQTKPPASQ